MARPDFDTLNAANIVDFIAEIFARRGADSYLGERVTMSQHMLQAAMLAERSGADDEAIAAALLHDIGHYTNEFGDDALERDIDNHHAGAGAEVLAPFFPERVTECARHHVAAKRYLCVVEPGYFECLSPASVHTLRLQGGPMSAEEVTRFAALPHLDAIVRVRKWDEGAKIPGRATPTFEHYAPLLRRLVRKHTATAWRTG